MSSTPRPAPPWPRLNLPLGRLALALAAGSVLLAGALGYGLASWIGGALPWTAGVAAALGMLLTVLPLAALAAVLARAAEPAPAPGWVTPASGAMSRPQFIELAEREWARARRYGSGAALLLVEVDRFSRLVESFGRPAGATVLGELIHEIAPTLRGADALARYGDGQLAVFLAQADPLGPLDVAERIRERSEALEVPHAPQNLRLTVSVGVAHLRPAHLHLQALLEDAADALLAARHAGGNCVRAAPVEPGRLTPSDGQRNDQRAPKS